MSLWRRWMAQLVYARGTFFRYWGNWLCDVYYHQRAVDEFTRAIELDPGFALAYFSRGVLYWREFRNAYRAIRDLTRVMDLSPGWAEAWFNRAQAHYLRGDYDLAAADLEHYVAVGQDAGWLASATFQLALLRELQAEKVAGRGGRA